MAIYFCHTCHNDFHVRARRGFQLAYLKSPCCHGESESARWSLRNTDTPTGRFWEPYSIPMCAVRGRKPRKEQA